MKRIDLLLVGTVVLFLFDLPAFSQVQWNVTRINGTKGLSKSSIPASLLTLSTPSNYANITLHPDANVDQSEMSISAAPGNTPDVLAGDNATVQSASPVDNNQGYYFSSNGGVSYSGSDTLPTNSTDLADPAVANDLNGNAFFAFLKGDGIAVKKSPDGGATWSSEVAIPNPGTADKDHMTIDVNSSSPYKNYIYVAWRDLLPIPGSTKFSRSTDDGSTYSTPVVISGTSGYDFSQGVCLAVGPNGELYACWIYVTRGTVTGIGFNKSTDGGATWGTASQLSIPGFVGSLNYIKKNPIRASSIPSMAVDRSGGPNNGKIYIVWANWTSTGNPTFPNVYNIGSTSSTDGGVSWSSMVQVNNDNSATDKWEPWVNVDAYGGVNVVFYSSQIDPTNNVLTQAYMARSTSGGTANSFANYQVGSVAFTP